MTPEHIELHRAKFEALELSNGNPISHDQINEGRYFCEYQHSRWKGFLMHAENLEVEIPLLEGPNPESDWFRGYFSGEYQYRKSLIKLLESQGIKIKSSGSE